MRCLIVGTGIAGPTLAYWLLERGHEPVLVERAQALRTGGYLIDFWGAGFDVAERMGLLDEIARRGQIVNEVRLVGARGEPVGGFSADVFDRIAGGRYASLARGDLAEAIYRTVEGRAETRFGEDLVALEQDDQQVTARFASGRSEPFDLVIGADGLHSKVRGLVFGEQVQFETYLGYRVAAFEVSGYRPRDEGVYVLHTEVGRQVARVATGDDRTMFLFVWVDEAGEAPLPATMADKRATLARQFGDTRWECPQILEAMAGVREIYVDRVSQIRMDSWSKGRVALVGDAACCPSLLAGQGSALAMVGAYVLAGELSDGLAPQAAFARYRELLGRPILDKQRAAARFAGSFAPRSAVGLWVRNLVSKLLRVPLVAQLAFGRSMRESIKLPSYHGGASAERSATSGSA